MTKIAGSCYGSTTLVAPVGQPLRTLLAHWLRNFVRTITEGSCAKKYYEKFSSSELQISISRMFTAFHLFPKQILKQIPIPATKIEI
jgi:hypothetical protein